ncbi:MAG TPA: HAMP domain-containing sensor histidine kinase [Bacteroidales bacterium]|nr:HAMP domain-containing sensor histidine kinase [Bacteroidales bacterium]
MTEGERQELSKLNEAIKQLLQGKKNIRFESTPVSDVPEINELQTSVANLLNQYNQSYDFVLDLSKGKLETEPPLKNNMIAPFKQLQADLKHLTWQIHQISEGDLEQNVSFSGDFSVSINKMIDSLREKQRISELNQKYLNDLEELNASKDKLFSIIAHDLKNPFSGLINLSDMVLSDFKENHFENIGEYAALLKTFSLQGYKLLINLLDWAKVQSNTVQVHLEILELSEVVDLSKALVEPVAMQKKIIINKCLTEQVRVIADTNMLQTVLRNLLSNAVKFTPSGGTIVVSTEKTESAVKISIQDNGVGMSPENLKRLFRIDSPFSTSGTANEFGSGLGLILCKDFLQKMNSEIQVESVVGMGSTFSFTLPTA